MRVLLVVLLVGIAGCGGDDNSPGGGAVPTPPKSTQAKVVKDPADTPQAKVGADPVTKPKPGSKSKTDKPPAQAAVADPVAALKKLGATIKQNEQGEVVEVSLRNRKLTDAGLVHLKGLTNLQTLSLGGTRITGAGLVHLKGLAKLETLNIRDCQIRDAGLVHLKGLTTLQDLSLGRTEVSDAGLVHLKGLTTLQWLTLPFQITDAGVADLQKALPSCKIEK
jgi:Leucine-rich repeat (LRR) protein